MRRDSSETKRKILTVCVRLFLEQGYKNTTVSQIVDEAGVARGSYLNLFPTKDRILLELTETMFGGQFGVARSIADSKLPPVYAYAVETAIQLTLTELNENLREIYIEAYSLPETSEYIYLHTTAELKQIFGENFPDDTESDFYEMEIGTAGLMRSYMARKCDIHFPLERKLSRFLTAAMRVYRVPEEEQAKVLAKSIVTSSLTKAAIFGHDANWGRILCAMGYSGADLEPEKVDIYFESEAGKLKIVENGKATDYSEEKATEILSKNPVIAIADVKMGNEEATAWGCDLTFDYVKINADYRS